LTRREKIASYNITQIISPRKSLEWGWKLISAYLYYFPPTIRFQGYLEGYLYKNKENDLNQCEVGI